MSHHKNLLHYRGSQPSISGGQTWIQALFESIESLKEAGFTGFLSAEELRACRCQLVPEVPGVYLAVRDDEPPPFEMSWETHRFGKDPSFSLDELLERWVLDTVVVYIGKAGGDGINATLRRRVIQFVRFGEGKNYQHWGGRSVWQLAEPERTQIAWRVTRVGESPREVEQRLIKQFRAEYGCRPFANLRG